MDRATLDAHSLFWGVEDCPLRVDLLRLTQEELTLYRCLRDNTIREGVRLEQEYIRFGWLKEHLRGLVSDTKDLCNSSTGRTQSLITKISSPS
jgi:hypothetical protein